VPRAEIVGPFPEGVEPEAYDQLRRRVLWALPQGLYLLSSRAGEVRNLMTVSLVSQLATSPKLLGVSVEADALTTALITESGRFLLAVLPRSERAVIRHFVKPTAHDEVAHTLAGYPYRDAPQSGLPVPVIAAAYLTARCARASTSARTASSWARSSTPQPQTRRRSRRRFGWRTPA
jgi:flavin reductase (DIM6/NTAB) family NADH-FMN oxidoreductase RutF